MDFRPLLDQFSVKACVLSMEKLPDGSYGNLRIVEGNRAYIDSIEHAPPGMGLEGAHFVPNSPYERYFAREPLFEDYCYRCAILKQPLHAYVHPDRFAGIWIKEYLLPLESDREGVGYCIFSNEIDFSSNPGEMTNVSFATASSVLGACIKLRGAEFKKAIVEVVSDIRRLCGANYCCILQVDEADRKCALLGESLDESLLRPSEEVWLNDSFYAVVETWPEALAGSNCLIIKDAADMALLRQRCPIWHESLVAGGCESLVLFPLSFRDTLLGYVWVSNFDTGRAVQIKEVLELMTFFIASEMASNRLIDRLRDLSSTDQMTGLLNRNAMNDQMDRFAAARQSRPLGLVMVDLNGLKQTNDSFGHRAGDLLIRKAARFLRESFPEREIYRLGGDEFVVMLPDATQAEMDGEVTRFHERLAACKDLSMAVGSCYCPDCRQAEAWLRTVDARMYEDKHAVVYTPHG